MHNEKYCTEKTCSFPLSRIYFMLSHSVCAGKMLSFMKYRQVGNETNSIDFVMDDDVLTFYILSFKILTQN